MAFKGKIKHKDMTSQDDIKINESLISEEKTFFSKLKVKISLAEI